VVVMTILAAEPPKVACTSFTCSEDLGPALCEAYERRFTGRLSRNDRVRVTTPRDIGQLLGLERQKQLLGCADEDSSSCNAELAGALGVEGILTGVVTRTPSGYLLSVKVIRVKDGREWASANESARDDGELQDALDATADRFVPLLEGAKPGTGARVVWWAGTVLGLGMVAGGAALFALSKQDAAILKRDTPQTPAELDMTASRGSTLQSAGAALLGFGIPIALTCFILAVALPAESGGFAVAPLVTADGAFVSAGWLW